MIDEVAAGISSFAAGDIFEMGSNKISANGHTFIEERCPGVFS